MRRKNEKLKHVGYHMIVKKNLIIIKFTSKEYSLENRIIWTINVTYGV